LLGLVFYIVDFSAGTDVLLYVFVAAGIEAGIGWFAVLGT